MPQSVRYRRVSMGQDELLTLRRAIPATFSELG